MIMDVLEEFKNNVLSLSTGLAMFGTRCPICGLSAIYIDPGLYCCNFKLCKMKQHKMKYGVFAEFIPGDRFMETIDSVDRPYLMYENQLKIQSAKMNVREWRKIKLKVDKFAKGLGRNMRIERRDISYFDEITRLVLLKNSDILICPYCLSACTIDASHRCTVCTNPECISRHKGAAFDINNRRIDCERTKERRGRYLKYIIGRKVALKIAERSLYLISMDEYNKYMEGS